ncbi:MAG: methyltransferase domain-containing protein [Candidatus Bathyarchaeota archaeon]|nr:methyltransferase domain-containing protein [Candidatus Bathyarchaeota archaeon]
MKGKDFQSFIQQLPKNESSLHLLDYASLFRLKLIHNLVGDVKDKTILDLGCGNGSISYLLWYLGANVYSVDISKQALFDTKNLGTGFDSNICQGDATMLPFKPESFDLVFCVETLEHIQDDQTAIKQIEKVSKSGGTIVLAVPYSSRADAAQDSVKNYRYYSFKTMKNRLFSEHLRFQYMFFWYFPLLKLLEMLRVRVLFTVLGYLVEPKNEKIKPKTGGRFASSLTAFYNTRFWRRLAMPVLLKVFDLNMLFKNLPYSDDVFLVFTKTENPFC